MRTRYKMVKLAAGAGLLLGLQIVPSSAGDRHCYRNCYEQVPAPAMHRTFLRRETLERGEYEIDREPSLYGLATRRVMVDDGIEWRETAPVYKTVKVRSHTRSHVIWTKRWVNGKHIMCKVRVPGETVWVEKRIRVSGGHRTKLRGQPTYAYEQERILIRPYKNIAIYHRAQHRYLRERVTIQPESFVWQPLSGGPAYR